MILYSVNNKTDKTTVEPEITKTNFEKALTEFQFGRYERAKTFLGKINENDSNYKEAQEYLVKCDEKIEQKEKDAARQEKIDKIREAEKKKLEKKYKQIFGGRVGYTKAIKASKFRDLPNTKPVTKKHPTVLNK